MHRETAARFEVGYGRAALDYGDVLDPTLAPVARRIVELVNVAADEHVLDVATGTGSIAREAAMRGATVVGIDIADEMIARPLALTLDDSIRGWGCDFAAFRRGAV